MTEEVILGALVDETTADPTPDAPEEYGDDDLEEDENEADAAPGPDA